MIYCENIVKILWTWQLFFFLLIHRFHNFFFPFSAMALPQLPKQIFFFNFRQCHCHNCHFFFIFFIFYIFGNAIATIANIYIYIYIYIFFLHFRQWHCHNCQNNFYFYFFTFSAMVLPQLPKQIFFLFFFLHFRQCHCHN